jgi:uracil phosphoribosyltransferase
MDITIFNRTESIYNTYLSELRDVNIQNDSFRFRTNIERMGQIMAYEISKNLDYTSQSIQTPLGNATEQVFNNQPVIASVLRAGLPLHQGIHKFFDRAENAFVSAYRIEGANGELDFKVEYNACPNLDGKTLILADPMLATGNSMWLAYQALLTHGTPKFVHIAAIIGSPEGVKFIENHFDSNTHLWIGAIDEGLDENAYMYRVWEMQVTFLLVKKNR